MSKLYNILLDKELIGTTSLEKADARAGVVFGNITFLNITSGYSFFKDYCKKNRIEFNDFPDVKLISTGNIPNLRVINNNGTEIKGSATSVDGMDSDVFEITITGIPRAFYAEEFPNHIKNKK